jgi:hypothetical protein
MGDLEDALFLAVVDRAQADDLLEVAVATGH